MAKDDDDVLVWETGLKAQLLEKQANFNADNADAAATNVKNVEWETRKLAGKASDKAITGSRELAGEQASGTPGTQPADVPEPPGAEIPAYPQGLRRDSPILPLTGMGPADIAAAKALRTEPEPQAPEPQAPEPQAPEPQAPEEVRSWFGAPPAESGIKLDQYDEEGVLQGSSLKDRQILQLSQESPEFQSVVEKMVEDASLDREYAEDWLREKNFTDEVLKFISEQPWPITSGAARMGDAHRSGAERVPLLPLPEGDPGLRDWNLPPWERHHSAAEREAYGRRGEVWENISRDVRDVGGLNPRVRDYLKQLLAAAEEPIGVP